MKGNSATQPLCAISVTVLLAVVNTVTMKLTEKKVYLDLWFHGDKFIITGRCDKKRQAWWQDQGPGGSHLKP